MIQSTLSHAKRGRENNKKCCHLVWKPEAIATFLVACPALGEKLWKDDITSCCFSYSKHNFHKSSECYAQFTEKSGVCIFLNAKYAEVGHIKKTLLISKAKDIHSLGTRNSRWTRTIYQDCYTKQIQSLSPDTWLTFLLLL